MLILMPFLGYGGYLAENCIFSNQLSFCVPSPHVSFGCSRLRDEVYHKETTVIVERPHDCSLSRFDTIPACDGEQSINGTPRSRLARLNEIDS